MKTVSVSVLKAQLSHYLREVARGGEIQVVDRGVPVARITGATGSGDNDARRERLAASGVLRLGNGEMKRVLRARPVTMRGGLSSALQDDREDRA